MDFDLFLVPSPLITATATSVAWHFPGEATWIHLSIPRSSRTLMRKGRLHFTSIHQELSLVYSTTVNVERYTVCFDLEPTQSQKYHSNYSTQHHIAGVVYTMASKKSKAAPTEDELNELFEGLGDNHAKAEVPAKKGASKAPKAAPSQSEQDLLAELENLGAQPSSRPGTPRVQAAKRSIATPPPGSSRTSEDKPAPPRKSGESNRSFHTSFTPSATSSDLQEAERRAPIAQPAEQAAPEPAAAGGGWWGSVFATASAAVKTAENAVKEIQQNEEAKRWAEQVKGNVGALRGLGKNSICNLQSNLANE